MPGQHAPARRFHTCHSFLAGGSSHIADGDRRRKGAAECQRQAALRRAGLFADMPRRNSRPMPFLAGAAEISARCSRRIRHDEDSRIPNAMGAFLMRLFEPHYACQRESIHIQDMTSTQSVPTTPHVGIGFLTAIADMPKRATRDSA